LLIALAVTRYLSIVAYAIIVLVYHAGFIIFWALAKNRILSTPAFGKINRWTVAFLPLVFSGIFWVWYSRIYGPVAPGLRAVIILFVILLGAFIYAKFVFLQRFELRFRKHWWIYALLAILLVGLVYFPALDIDRHHYNFFLAPVNDILHGSILFVNSTSQYGIGVVYFLATIFRLFHLPVDYYEFSLIIDVLFILEYATVFLILHKGTKSLLLSLAGIGAILYFNFLSVFWPSMLRIPAQTPLRYGLTYVLILVALFGASRSKGIWLGIEYLLIGVCAVWSLETFIYSILSLDAFHFVVDILYADQPRGGIKLFAKRLAYQSGVVLLSWGVLICLSRLLSNHFPNPSYYLQFFTSYTEGDFYSHPINFRSFWTGVAVGVYLVSIFLVLFSRLKGKNYLSREMASLMTAMSVAGLLQYSYYFVYDIDYHLALLCVPLIFVLILWAAIVLHDSPWKKVPLYLKFSLSAALVISVWFCMQSTNMRFHSIIKNSFFYGILSEVKNGNRIDFPNLASSHPSDKAVSALVALIQKYTPDETRIAIFAQAEDQTEALLITGKTDLAGMSDPEMSTISPAYRAHVLDQTKTLAGDPRYIFYDATSGALIDMQENAFKIMTATTPYKAVDKIGNIIVYSK
jgi:hypothetical protein